MKKTIEIFEISYIEADDILPSKVTIYKDFLGGLDIDVPHKYRDRRDLTKLLRNLADDLEKHFPDC